MLYGLHSYAQAATQTFAPGVGNLTPPVATKIFAPDFRSALTRVGRQLGNAIATRKEPAPRDIEINDPNIGEEASQIWGICRGLSQYEQKTSTFTRSRRDAF